MNDREIMVLVSHHHFGGKWRQSPGAINWAPTAPLHGGEFKIGVPTGIRTPVLTVKGWCPRPLDDGDAGRKSMYKYPKSNLVEPGGIEPPTSCMPCKRSPS
jgi:hypothetical protein